MNDRIRRLILSYGKINTPNIHTESNGFNASETGVLWAIAQISYAAPQTELFSLGELNKRLNYTRPNLSQTINKLQDKGIVERTVQENDRRATAIFLTEKGKELMQKKQRAVIEKFERVLSDIGEENTERFLELFEIFAESFRKNKIYDV